MLTPVKLSWMPNNPPWRLESVSEAGHMEMSRGRRQFVAVADTMAHLA